jgi:hypothetical protein
MDRNDDDGDRFAAKTEYIVIVGELLIWPRFRGSIEGAKPSRTRNVCSSNHNRQQVLHGLLHAVLAHSTVMTSSHTDGETQTKGSETRLAESYNNVY